jgi:two-component system, LytTR family, response regulator
MNTTSCIIVEDEPLAAEKLVDFIAKVPWLELCGSFHSGIEALRFIQKQTVDLIFLDIQMEGLTGIQMLESMSYRPHIILTTAYSNYATKAFDLQVDDYLLKPYSFERFLQAIQKACAGEKAESRLIENRNYIFVKTDYRYVKIMLEDILYIEGMRDYRCLITKKGKILTLATFTELSGLLKSSEFVRVHKSFIVSLNHIKTIEHQRIYIAEKIIPISDTYKAQFYQAINFNIN